MRLSRGTPARQTRNGVAHMVTTRRRFMATAAASSLALVESANASTAAVDDAVAGMLVQVMSPTIALVRLAGSGDSVTVRLGKGADVLPGRSGQSERDLSLFVPGEEVALRFVGAASPSGEKFVSMFQSMVSSVAVQVSTVSDSGLETSAGYFTVSEENRGRWRDRRGPARITYWTNPVTGERVANSVLT